MAMTLEEQIKMHGLIEENRILREALKADIVENHLHDFYRRYVLNEGTNDIKSMIGRLSKKAQASREKVLEVYKSFLEEIFQEPLAIVRAKMDSIKFTES